MTRLMFKPVHMGELKEMLDQQVWYSNQAPASYRVMCGLGSWLAGCAVFGLLTAVARLSGGDVFGIILIGWFGGAIVSCIASGVAAMIVSVLLRLTTGKGLYSSVSAPAGLKDLDPTATALRGAPIAIGLFGGIACWLLGFDPTLGLAAALGLG